MSDDIPKEGVETGACLVDLVGALGNEPCPQGFFYFFLSLYRCFRSSSLKYWEQFTTVTRFGNAIVAGVQAMGVRIICILQGGADRDTLQSKVYFKIIDLPFYKRFFDICTWRNEFKEYDYQTSSKRHEISSVIPWICFRK